MSSETLRLDRSNDIRDVAQVARHEVEQNSPFNVTYEETGKSHKIDSSINTVNVRRGPDSIIVNINGEERVVQAVRAALTAEFTENTTEEMNEKGGRTRTPRDQEEMGVDRSSSSPMRGSRDPEDTNTNHGKVEANFTVYEDGHVEGDIGGEDFQMDTVMGLFLPYNHADGNPPVMYVDDDTPITRATVNRIIDSIRQEMMEREDM